MLRGAHVRLRQQNEIRNARPFGALDSSVQERPARSLTLSLRRHGQRPGRRPASTGA
jgi:hypothetical protein